MTFVNDCSAQTESQKDSFAKVSVSLLNVLHIQMFHFNKLPLQIFQLWCLFPDHEYISLIFCVYFTAWAYVGFLCTL